MTNLNEVRNGQECRITWLVGNNGRYLKDHFDLQEEDRIRVVQNLRGNMLVSHGDRKLAMDRDFASAVKVENIA